MAYDSSLLLDKIIPLNRKAAVVGKFGVDSGGVQWEEGPCLHAYVTWAKGMRAMNAGALDAYSIKQVRMRWTDIFDERSRIKFNGRTYQILPDTFNPDRRNRTLQFNMQLIVNDKQPAPKPSSNTIGGGNSSGQEIGK